MADEAALAQTTIQGMEAAKESQKAALEQLRQVRRMRHMQPGRLSGAEAPADGGRRPPLVPGLASS